MPTDNLHNTESQKLDSIKQDFTNNTHITSATLSHPRLFAVLGNPISHSLSPLIHNYAYDKLSTRLKQHSDTIDSQPKDSHYHEKQNLYLNKHAPYLNQQTKAFYTRFALPLQTDSKGLRDFLLQSDLHGVNVTVPFKETAYQAVDKVYGIAKKIQAINTIIKRGNTLLGYNTDAEGFILCMESYRPKKVLILGAGGSAKSVAIILSHHKIPFCVANRSVEKLAFFQSLAETKTFESLINEVKQSKNNASKYDIIINATSAGLSKNLPLPKEILQNLFSHSHLAFDLMYQQEGLTTFCALANECGIKFLDGKNMLVYQAAIAFMYFHGLDCYQHNTTRNLSLLDSQIDTCNNKNWITLQEIITTMKEALGL